MRTTLTLKLRFIFALLTCVTVFIAIYAVAQMRTDSQRAQNISLIEDSALDAQIMSNWINSLTADGLSVLNTDSPADVKSGLLNWQKSLEAFEIFQKGFFSRFNQFSSEKESLLLRLQVQEFIAYQRDTAALGLQISPKAAMVQASDEATIKNRSKMIRTIQAFSAALRARLPSEREAAQTAQSDATQYFIMITTFSLIISVVSATWFARTYIERLFNRLEESLQALAANDLERPIGLGHRSDEFGSIARSLKILQKQLLEKKQSDQTLLAHNANDVERAHRLSAMIDQFRAKIVLSVDNLRNSYTRTHDVASSMQQMTTDTTQWAELASYSSDRVVENINGSSASAEEFTTTAQGIKQQIACANQITAQARLETEKSDHAVEELSRSTNEIGNIVELISNIAAQTNLLALNATIEAARAGEAGRGFSVVASEVKLLAAQTTSATQQISQRINAVQTATDATVETIGAIGVIIAKMHDVSDAILGSVAYQKTAGEAISRTISVAASESRHAVENLADLKSTAIQSRVLAADLIEVSKRLKADSCELDQDISTFLEAVQAA